MADGRSRRPLAAGYRLRHLFKGKARLAQRVEVGSEWAIIADCHARS